MYIKNYILFLIFIIIFNIIILSIYNVKNELFGNNGNLIIVENIYNFPTDFYISPVIIDLILGELKKSNNKSIPSNLLKFNNTNFSTVSLYIDPYVNYYMLNNTTNIVLYDKKGYFVYISPFKLGKEECPWDFANKTIAYTCITDYYFINAIIKGHRIDKNTVKLIRISPNDLNNRDEITLKKKFDAIITYVIPGTKYVSILENTNYTVTGFRDMDINPIKAFYPFVIDDYINLFELFPKKVLALTVYDNNKDSTSKLSTPSLYYNVLNNISIEDVDGFDNKIEKFITKVELSKDAYDPSYFCYGDTKINNKFMCNSPYEIDGELKTNYTFWDKICTKNEDCAYYNKNTKKGGCNIITGNKNINLNNIGYCEFPVGIKRLGFTKFVDTGSFSPLCYGCDENDLDCCKKHNNTDYVYPNDFNERSKNKKDTVVSKMDYVI